MIVRYAADFETTTNEHDCRVWGYAICEIGNTDNFQWGTQIDDFMDWCQEEQNTTVYFHNLKFDGEFVLNWLFANGYKHVDNQKAVESKTFTTLISDKGVFYSITVYFEKSEKVTRKITFLDSYKILPFKVKQVSKAFNLPLSKLEIDYHKDRPIGYQWTPEEYEYIKNDVTIMAMALDVVFLEGQKKMTIGSNAMADYKGGLSKREFERTFPIPFYDKDIRAAYRGGFTYADPRWQEKDVEYGITLDVNSLYPSVMYYKMMPYGMGKYFEGQYEPDEIYPLYVQTFKCQFELKPGHIPTVQLKNTLQFIPTEYITSSGDKEVELCMTSVDLELFFKHYDVYNPEYIAGWKFKATDTMFKAYIEKWNGRKVQATLEGNEAIRTLCKLMLNNLYGKFALNPEVRNKIPYYSDGRVKYRTGPKCYRDPVYIPVGAFVTAWARHTTISAAQLLYDRFLYADTDSLHLIGTELPTCIEISNTELGAWKHEGTFRRARYLRQKTYIEDLLISEKKYKALLEDNPSAKVYIENGQHYHMDITCAGMPEKCYDEVTWDNFVIGSAFNGKLVPRHVPGGIILAPDEFTIRRFEKKKTIDKVTAV